MVLLFSDGLSSALTLDPVAVVLEQSIPVFLSLFWFDTFVPKEFAEMRFIDGSVPAIGFEDIVYNLFSVGFFLVIVFLLLALCIYTQMFDRGPHTDELTYEGV